MFTTPNIIKKAPTHKQGNVITKEGSENYPLLCNKIYRFVSLKTFVLTSTLE